MELLIEDNFKSVIEELNSTGRTGIDKLVKFLETSDFKTAPASTKFHLNVEGGLAKHSLNVLDFARMINEQTLAGIKDDVLILTSLLHDLCKINYYVKGEEWDKEHKDKTNQWIKKEVWKVEDKAPLGHGEKSAIIASTYIDLSVEELAAIRWHMGFSEPGTHFSYPVGQPFRDSLDRYPLVKIIMMADQMAEMYETLQNDRS